MYVEPKISSSYYKNIKGAKEGRGVLHAQDWDVVLVDNQNDDSLFSPEIGKVLYDYIIEHKPEIVVDFGVLYGFSTICMAQALRDLNMGGKVYAYDLWGDYKYNHGQCIDIVLENARKYDVQDFIDLGTKDLYQWLEEYHYHGVGSLATADLAHIDVGNDGDLLKKINDILKLRPNIRCDILFEGGTEERDNCFWMREFNKTKMKTLEHTYEVLSENYPGLSRIIK